MNINKKQKKFVVIGVAVIILMGLFPPWTHTFKSSSIHSEEPAGYGLIISPPPRKGKNLRFGIKIDISRLVIQWVVTIAAMSAGVMLTAKKDD